MASPCSWAKVNMKAKYDGPFQGCPISAGWDGPVTSKAREAVQGRTGFGPQSWGSGPKPPELPWEGWGQCPSCTQEKAGLQRQRGGMTRKARDMSWWRWLWEAPGLWATGVPWPSRKTLVRSLGSPWAFSLRETFILPYFLPGKEHL